MSDQEPQIDPDIFSKEHELEFSFALGGVAQDYVAAIDIISRYEAENSDEAKASKLKKAKEHPEVKEHVDRITDMLGSALVGEFIDEILVEGVTDPADEATYREALEKRGESTTVLVGYVFGYQAYMQERLLDVFDGDQDEAGPASWTAAWSKLRGTLHPLEGTILAEVADFFDGIIHWRYADSYDHSDVHRGIVVAQDTSARTFYEVMESHLTRSIVKRPDDWSR